MDHTQCIVTRIKRFIPVKKDGAGKGRNLGMEQDLALICQASYKTRAYLPLGSPNKLEGLIMVQSSAVFFIACSERCLACMYFEPFGSGLAPSALIKRNLFTPFCSATAATRSDPLNWSLRSLDFALGIL